METESSISVKDCLGKEGLSLESEASSVFDEKHKAEVSKVTMVKSIGDPMRDPTINVDIQRALHHKTDFISEQKKQHKLASKQIMEELGIDSPEILNDPKKVEEFIVLRAIKDISFPKLDKTDGYIF